MTLAAIPGFAPKGSETHAYTLEEVKGMLRVLSGAEQTVVAVAAYSGLRAGEIRGLTWEEYELPADKESFGFIHVRRSVWRKHTTDPKTEKSRAAVPVIPQLAAQLDSSRRLCGNPKSGPIFANGARNPISLDSLYWRKMREVLGRAEIEWSGWHGFRRGLASNLNRLGVDDSVIQAILRHSHIGVTQSCYIKTVRPDVEAAMRQFSEYLQETCSQVVLEKGVSEPSHTLQ